MGIFTRMRDIVSSNINAMLDKAENPEKLLRLMIQEMEDTLIEIKAQCASAMAQSKRLDRQVAEACARADQWNEKAELALAKGRDDLAREALLEKRRWLERVAVLQQQLTESDGLIDQYKNDITQLESKMQSVREKQKLLIQRHAHAQTQRKAQEHIRRADGSDVLNRFDSFERRIDHMEAAADLVNYGVKPAVEDEFERLEGDEELEKELESLRQKMQGNKTDK